MIFINGYLEFLISSILAYKAPEGSPDATDFFKALWIFSLVVALIIIPLLMLWIILCDSMKTLNSEKFSQKWGMIYREVKTRNKWDLLWIINNIFRRAVFVFASFYLLPWPSLQVLSVNFLTLISIIIIGKYKPLKGVTANRMGTFNEVMIMECNFLFMCFTNFVYNEERKF